MIFKIISKKYGLFHVRIDDADFEKISKYTWHIRKTKIDDTFYVATNIKNGNGYKALKLHRFIADAKSGEHVDHKDHDALNNTRENLRICTQQQNNHNKRKVNKNKTSLYKGVSFYKPTQKI